MMPFFAADRSVRWLPAAVAALCWALTAGSAALWWVHAPQDGGQVAVSPGAAPMEAVNTTTIFRALGHLTAAPEAAGDVQRRFQLLGVVAGASGRGAALLAVDGQPPQAFVQNQAVAEGWRVQSLTARGVVLQGLGRQLQLELPN